MPACLTTFYPQIKDFRAKTRNKHMALTEGGVLPAPAESSQAALLPATPLPVTTRNERPLRGL